MEYTLTSVITEYLIEIGASQSNLFPRYYQFGVNFLRSKHFDTFGVPQIVELTINDNDTADLPLDYVQYTKIALCVNGKLFSLGLNNSICLDKSYNDCGEPVASSTSVGYSGFGLSPLFTGDHFRNGEFLGKMYGLSSDNNCLGEYRIDKEYGQIKFSGLTSTSTVVLEYLNDPDAVDGEFSVHPFCLEALKDSLAHQYKVRSNKPLGEQQMAHNLAKISNRNMKHRFMSSTLAEWEAAFQSGNQQTPKMGNK